MFTNPLPLALLLLAAAPMALIAVLIKLTSRGPVFLRQRRYGLDGWKPAPIAHFGRVHFGAGAGLAQQYLFAAERAAGRKSLSRIT